MFIPSMLLKQLYTHGSLQKTEDGLCFMLKNRLKDAHLEEILQISLDGKHISPRPTPKSTVATRIIIMALEIATNREPARKYSLA